MLLLESRHLSQAKEQFAALSGSADLALRAYSEAMMALADDDQAMARDKLALGLRQKSSNRALGKSMRRVLDQLAKNAAAGGRDPADNPMFLGAYRDASS
jgi:hypothetical protein